MKLTWDEWRGSMDGRETLWVKHLWRRLGRHIDLHKMVGKDDPDCFHTHPAYAIRVILRGGYVEELEGGRHRMWRPGMIGIVKPTCSHRIAGLRNGRASYSLWIRFRKRATVELRGDGWHRQEQTYRAADTVLVRRAQ
ncbi:MAG: hypothetical protein LC750_00625 [Actinobacteria bacterium]|nr:hypothetical protein [Actinomycetota bacterium]